MGGRRIHVFRQIEGSEIPDEFAGILDVLDGVLPGRRGKADDRRLVAKAVEEAVGREVDVALAVARGNPPDRARRNDGVEGVVLEAVAVLGFVEMQVLAGHAGIPWWARHSGARDSANPESRDS